MDKHKMINPPISRMGGKSKLRKKLLRLYQIIFVIVRFSLERGGCTLAKKKAR